MTVESGRPSRLLGAVADFVAARPKRVVTVAAIIAIASLTQVVRLEVTTSRTNLGHPANEAEADFGRFLDEFGSPNDLTAVIDIPAHEGQPPLPGDVETLRAAADEMARELDQHPDRVRSTFHKVDIDFFLSRILLFVPANELGQIQRVLASSFADDIRAGKVNGLDAVIDEFTSIFTTRAGPTMDPQRAARGLDALGTILKEGERRFKDPRRKGFEGLREMIPPLKAGAIDDEGYLQSRDGGIRLLFIRPAVSSDENSVVLPLVTWIRATTRAIAARHPGVRVRVTGLPAMQADETVIVDRDLSMTTILSLVAITLILLYGYRRPQQVLLSLVPLLIGVLVTMAICYLAYGRVNLVASAFMPILLGRGSDFAIYIIARFNSARQAGRSAREGVREALESAGGGIVTGALVTSAAFLVSTIGQLGVFSQLGVIVGVGLVAVLVASLLVTPALLLLVGDRKMPGEAAMERFFERLPAFTSAPGVFALKQPGLVLGATGALLLILGAFARDTLPFDYDLLKFIPREAESATAQRDLSARSDYGTDVVVVAAKDVETARAQAAELANKPNVARVESIASFLPSDQAHKLEQIATLRALVVSLPPFNQPQPPTAPDKFSHALEELGDAVDDKEFVAKQASSTDEKLKPIVQTLHDFGAVVASMQATVKEMDPATCRQRIGNLEDQVFGLLIRSRQLLRVNVLDARPVSIDDLPRATRERFVGKHGQSAIYVFPRKTGAGDELKDFVADVRSVSPNATGFPIIYFESSRSILHSFMQAALLALLVIVVALLLHFRSVPAAAMALLPLALATVAMAGLMRMLHIYHNIANIVALPLLLGLGTDYGLQLVHHYRTVPDERLIDIVKKTGLGVFMAGGTTAAGFGALALARHKGGQSLGLVLFLGTSAALVCSLIVLPAVLALAERYWPRRPAK